MMQAFSVAALLATASAARLPNNALQESLQRPGSGRALSNDGTSGLFRFRFTDPPEEETFTEPGVEETFTEPGVEETFTEPGVEDTFTEPGVEEMDILMDAEEENSEVGTMPAEAPMEMSDIFEGEDEYEMEAPMPAEDAFGMDELEDEDLYAEATAGFELTNDGGRGQRRDRRPREERARKPRGDAAADDMEDDGDDFFPEIAAP